MLKVKESAHVLSDGKTEPMITSRRPISIQRKLKITGDNARDGDVFIQIFPAEGKTV